MAVVQLPPPLVDRARGLIVPAVVFTLPFEFTGAFLPFRLDLARLLTIAAVGLLVVDLGSKRRWPALPRTASAAWLGLFVIEAAASWALTRTPGAVTSLAPLLAYPLLTLVVLNLVRTPADQRNVVVALLASSVVVCLVGISMRATGHYLVGPDPSFLGRVNATFYDPDILARFLALAAAAGLLAAGHSFPQRWRAAALVSGLFAAAVLPITLSRVGFVLLLLVAGAAIWFVRPRVAAIGGAVGVLAVSALMVGVQPQVRDRAANLWMLVQELGQLWTQPAAITRPEDDGPPLATIKTCGVPTGWENVRDDRALFGWASEVHEGATNPAPVVFGPPLTLPAGTFHAWVRVRVDDPEASVPQLRIGVWDPSTDAFLPGLFEDDAPRGFARDYRWFLIGTVQAPVARTVQFRVVEFATTTTAWYFDRFSLTSSDRSAAAGLEEPWRSGALIAGTPVTSGGFQSVVDEGAST
ncbi:MAG TPA: hypothetical protein VOB72_20000, partial [Candidatus Dormibacteraeota bacterium]|nr:hypothetical protein [Candidatus Dormibacteraeota bacterium]